MTPHYLSLYKQACNIPIASVLDHFNIDHSRGFHYLMDCPFPSHVHTSHTPSFKIYESTNSFYCFGCKKAGQVPHFVQFMLGLKSLEKALDYMTEHFGLKSSSVSSHFADAYKRIKGETKELDKQTIILLNIKQFLPLFEDLRAFNSEESMMVLADSSSSLSILKYFYEGGKLDRTSYEQKLQSLKSNIIQVIAKCRQQFAQDVGSQSAS